MAGKKDRMKDYMGEHRIGDSLVYNSKVFHRFQVSIFKHIEIPFENSYIVISCLEDDSKNEKSGSTGFTTLSQYQIKYVLSLKKSLWSKIASYWSGSNDDANKLKRYIDKIVAELTLNNYYTDSPITIWNNRSHYTKTLPPSGNITLKQRLYINFSVKRAVLKDIKWFINNKQEYRNKGKLYVRTYLLRGPPGTGKTKLIQFIAEHYILKMNIVKSLTWETLDSITNRESFDPKYAASPKVLIIEDIDLLLEEAQNHAKNNQTPKFNNNENSEMNMSYLMSMLDGSCYIDNVMIFITTNHPERIDERLLRPGRINANFLIDGLSEEKEIERLIRDNLSCDVSNEEILEAVASFANSKKPISSIVSVIEQKNTLRKNALVDLMTDLDCYEQKMRTKRQNNNPVGDTLS